MRETDLRIFIDGVTDYFQQVSEQPVTVHTPYILEQHVRTVHEFTGLMHLAGQYCGYVYFSAPGILLKHLLLSLGETNTDTQGLRQLVVEIATQIAVRATAELGQHLVITPPQLLDTVPVPLLCVAETATTFAIPVSWRSYEATVVIHLAAGSDWQPHAPAAVLTI